jgi:HSP20 family protein
MLVTRVWPARPTFERAFSEGEALRREMLRLFEGFSGERKSATEAGVFPPLNLTQDADHFYLRAEIPGVSPSELSITALRNRVSLAGKREIKKEQERASYHRRERPEGTFNRTVTLPAEVDADRVVATYAHGILTITLPKAQTAKPREIAVRSGS